MAYEDDASATQLAKDQLEQEVEILLKMPQLRSIPPTLYHYTSAEGLSGIISSGKLWATNLLHLNDSSEFEYALDLATDVLTRRKADGPSTLFDGLIESLKRQRDFYNLYVVCFCEDGNSLNMWRSYASRGYCIGFKTEELFNYTQTTRYVDLVRVQYELIDQEWLVDQVINKILVLYSEWEATKKVDLNLIVAFAAHQILLSLISLKHEAFKEERELRVVRRYVMGQEKKEVNFRAANGVLIPYVELDLFKTANTGGKLPLEIIRYGPSSPEVPTEKAIRLLLDKKGYQDHEIKIEHCKIPLRG